MGALEGKVVIVTGGARGIGQSVSLACAEQGAHLVVIDADLARDGGPLPAEDQASAEATAEEIRRRGGQAIAVRASVFDRPAVEAALEAVVARFGRVDVLINLAGIVRDRSFLKQDDETWQVVLDVHLGGVLHTCQAFAKQVIKQGGGGRIINTISVSGLLGNFGQSNYAAAKAAVYGLSRTLSIELQRHRISVNCVAPLAKTRLTEDLPMFASVDTLTPEHVAPAYVYFASDLSEGKTGHMLAVAGARMYAFKLVETAGRFKEGDDDRWSAEEIAEHWDSIVK